MHGPPVGARSVLSLFSAHAERIGGIEVFAKTLTSRLNGAGWASILCFGSEPPEFVRDYLGRSACTLEVVPIWVEDGWGAVRAFAEAMKRHRPEVVHTHFLHPVTPFAWVARAMGARRIVSTDHISRRENGSVGASVFKRCIARPITWPLTSVICPSDFIAGKVRSLGFVAGQKVRRVFNAVDLTRRSGDGAAMRARLGIPPRAPVVLQVSWLIPEKGVDDLIAAAPVILARHPAARFVVAGEGWKGGDYRALVQAQGMESSFMFAGMVADPVAEGLYAMADVVVQPSRWQEAFGFTIAEAMAEGKPVVGTATGGIPEVIEDGVSGVLVPPRAPERLAEAVVGLLDDELLRRRMGAAGFRIVQERFNLDKNVAEVLQAYGVEEGFREAARAAAAAAP